MIGPFLISFVIDSLSKPKTGESAGGYLWIFTFISVPTGLILLGIFLILHVIWITKKLKVLSTIDIVLSLLLITCVVGFTVYLINDFRTPYNSLSRHDYKNINALYDNRPLIFMSIRAGNLEDVKKLVAHGHSIESSGFGGETPLLAASLAEQWDIVLFLLENGADYTAERKMGEVTFTLQTNIDRARNRNDDYHSVVHWLENQNSISN